ncbi:bacteriohemerythrin [Magnetospirillum sulfuroxidans]|uniref:Bacteriohemerythrin n=1 Tax=Magnetospirillum sulfuroxidans TaxID=611300 RepID=A0ABS5IFQ0_9PROT|nr:bacteriohemerythrin [Magnetospirillum sulfuroxidans]MBR9973247.1 bacteriohemerythrin [Magnetospirillum sulfuroxidans]
MARLFKIEVMPGMAWIHVPDADVRVLCGCPADSVKHLMRRGLIRPMEMDGVRFETGPNAILLSDVMVQNGAFCNLAEFPVLQMFYRQGLLLPGHPNNDGSKPIIIGRRDHVDAQMQYIYRGNYGLISEQELMEAGVPAAQAHEMMRLKLKFAFGAIRHPRDLLDGLALDSDPVEIKAGVSVRRIGLNRFEFHYDGETVEVDLNLPPFQTHDSPFPLGSFQFRRDYFAVVHSGEGDGWDVRRPSMGSVLVFQGRIYLVDAGPNLAHSLTALGIGINEIEGIFQTHSHDDHFAGLTTLMQADRRISYFAVPMVRSAVAKKLAALLSIEEKAFNDYFNVRDLVMDQWNDVDGLDVRPIFSPHPVETTIFHFRAMAAGGWRTYAHLADIVGLGILEGMITDDPTKPGLSREWYQQIAVDYLEPAEVKKVDIGAGLIHGYAEDFRDDTSGKIILAHTAQPLNSGQKKIGSGASFGTVDVLISGHRDFLGRAAFHMMTEYFPTVSGDHLGAVLNGPVTTFNPETILFKAGQPHANIYLLLTGQVEMLDDDSDFRAALSAGALLGESTGLHGLPPAETCRAVSFVQVLEIPADVYTAFVRRHNLFRQISRLLEGRDFLSRTRLLGDVVSTGTLNAIAKDMKLLQFADDSMIGVRSRAIGVIARGRVLRMLGDSVLETLGPGDFFGEETAIFDAPGITSLRAYGPTEIYMVSAGLLAAIPNVRWKLFEAFQRRASLESSVVIAGRTLLTWKQEYSVNIQRIDTQHKRLFVAANRLLDAVQSQRDSVEINTALDFLFSSIQFHFTEEEALLDRYGYEHGPAHKAGHQTLMTGMRELETRLNRETPTSSEELLDFLHGWIVNHIQIEDRRYAAVLNAQGVY